MALVFANPPSFLFMFYRLSLLGLSLALFCACTETAPPPSPPANTQQNTSNKEARKNIQVPSFDGKQAYQLVQKQVDFGPRVPGSPAHKQCADWIKSQLESYGKWEVQFQETQMQGKNGAIYPVKNIIASYKKDQTKRVLLCAHWDTRAVADQDSTRKNEPILGADDGGSGVAVLMHIAQILSQQNLNLGIDIVLFDTEDQGESGDDPRKPYRMETWCLGSQYWSRNPHTPNYTANFGILLDMVGSQGAQFPKEGYSVRMAGVYVDKIWEVAAQLGYSSLFLNTTTREIIDDHVFVNEIRKIPTLDIINLPENSRTGFGHYWHTHKDNMSIIDRNTLQAVGNTVLHSLYYYEQDLL